jgi:hypothetical protein
MGPLLIRRVPAVERLSFVEQDGQAGNRNGEGAEL